MPLHRLGKKKAAHKQKQQGIGIRSKRASRVGDTGDNQQRRNEQAGRARGNRLGKPQHNHRDKHGTETVRCCL
jgi:hypothetical protein